MAFNMKWLQQKKELAKQAKLQQQKPNPGYFASPFSMRYNTGYGEDGINQPNNPVMKVNTMNGQRMIHEGEELRPMSNGQVEVVSQKQLRDEELNGIPGYQQGLEQHWIERCNCSPIGRDVDDVGRLSDSCYTKSQVFR